MSLAGKLEEITLTELLQFIAYNRKTGKLTLTRRDGQGVIVFRAGRIIYAATHSMREAFGNILIRRGLIDETSLLQALDRHSQASEERRLGAILIEMGKVTREDLEEVMRHQTGVVLSELLAWKGGFFKFEPMQISDHGEVQVDATDFVVAEGISAEHVMLEIATKLDAQARDADRREAEADSPTSPVAPALEAPPSLASIITDLHSPALRAEITLAIMRYASQVVDRGVLLVVRGEQAVVNGHFGLERPPAGASAAIAELELPLNMRSMFSDVVEGRHSFRGRLAADPVDSRFLRCLGYPAPRESVIVPMLVDDRVVMLFYGDNGASDAPIRAIDGLELVMAESGLAMEKMALEAKLKYVETARLRA